MSATEQELLRASFDAPIQQNPNKLSGQPTIGAKRIQAERLIEYFAGGGTLQEFLEDYEGVAKEEALAVLGLIRQAIQDGLLTNLKLRRENSF